MNAVKPLEMKTPDEFIAMPKEEGWNYELIDGFVMMSPSPSREHQKISGNLYFALRMQLKDTMCQSLYEMDVTFHANVFKPDMMVFCSSEEELPEIVFEILSPSTRHRDLRVKLVKYEEMGVKEYWILDPKVKSITVHDFVNEFTEVYTIGEIAESKAHPEIKITVADIFA